MKVVEPTAFMHEIPGPEHRESMISASPFINGERCKVFNKSSSS